MTPKGSKALLPAILFFVALGLTGCATGGYWVNRGRDAADVFSLVGGVGGGAGVRIGPVCQGLIFHSNYVGLEGGDPFVGFNGDPGGFENGGMLVLPIGGVETAREADVPLTRGKGLEAQYLLGVAFPWSIECNPPKYNPSFFTQLEVTAGLGGTVKAGFNPGELLDFILGWFTLDIYGDDIGSKCVQQEKAKTSPDPDVRIAAMNLADDSAIFTELAQVDSDWTVRCAAVAHVTDQAILAQVALADSQRRVREAAVQNLQDPSVLAKVAKTDGEAFVRRSAVEKLKDQSVLAEIAIADEDEYVRALAVQMLSDPSLLVEVAQKASDAAVRGVAAVKTEGNRAEIERKALTGDEVEVREAAIQRVDDQAILSQLAISEPIPRVRCEAVKRLDDMSLLKKISRSDRIEFVREAAKKRLSDIESTRKK